MVKTETIKRIASKLSKCGIKKVWCDHAETAKISAAKTRKDVKELLDQGYIVIKPDRVHSKYHARQIRAKAAKGRKRGPGKVKGPIGARDPIKPKWIAKLREMRAELVRMRNNNFITSEEKKHFYMQAKGNMFKTTHIMIDKIKEKKEQDKLKAELDDQMKVLEINK